MAKGQMVGAHGKTRRNQLPRLSSPEGIEARAGTRAATKPKVTNKYSGGYKVAGSRNPRKVGRG